MPLIREVALDQPPFDNRVLLLDGNNELWWIDVDGDILNWIDARPPDVPYECRKTDVVIDDCINDNAAVNKAFAESQPLPNFDLTRDYLRKR